MPDDDDNLVGCITIIVLLQAVTYPMSLVRWFITDHNTFWFGFKELVWALVPLVNFTYVWDWWVKAIIFLVKLLIMLFNYVWEWLVAAVFFIINLLISI